MNERASHISGSAGIAESRPWDRPGRVRPRLGVLDLLLHLWRARLLMFLVFFAFVIAGLATTQLFPAKAIARASVVVATPAQVSMSVAEDGHARIDLRPERAELLVERELAVSRHLASRAIGTVGMDALAPERRIESVGSDVTWASDAEARFLDDLAVNVTLGASMLEFRFGHPNERVAVAALAAYVEAYLEDRRPAATPDLRDGRALAVEDTFEDLDDVNAAILAFMDEHGVTNLDAEIEAANATLGVVSAAQVEVQASLRAARARTGELEGEIGKTAPEIELFTETVTTDRVSALVSERDQMRARFGDEHPVVEELEGQISRAREEPARVLEAGRRRTGPNPVRQELMGDRSRARAEVAGLVQRAAALEDQRGQAEGRRSRLAALEPEWRALLRMRDRLELEEREQTGVGVAASAVSEQTSGAGPRLVEPAQLTGSGTPRNGVWALFAAAGLLCALVVGLLRALAARGLASAGAAERTLGLRTLASVGDVSRG